MRLLTRSTAIGLMLLLGQLMLVGSGYACLGQAHGNDRAAHVARSMSVRAAPDEHGGCDAAPRAGHCMLSGFSCTALGACGVAAMTSGAALGASSIEQTYERVAAPSLTPLTRSIAPELPPPRA